MKSLLSTMLVPLLLVGAAGWLAYSAVREHGRILVRLESLEKQVARGWSLPRPEPPPELPVGSPAPDFLLPELDGAPRSLVEFRGRRVLLVFLSPRCGFCKKMVPDLAALPPDGSDGRPVTVVVTIGDLEANRQLLREQGFQGPVLLQAEREVSTLYRVTSTPTAYLIDEAGGIASPRTLGAKDVLALASAGCIETAGGHEGKEVAMH